MENLNPKIRDLSVIIGNAAEEGQGHKEDVIKVLGLTETPYGYKVGDLGIQLHRVSGENQAQLSQQITDLIQADSSTISPAHLFAMSQKGAEALVVIKNGEAIAAVATYLDTKKGLNANITHTAGEPEMVKLAATAIQADLIAKGVTLNSNGLDLSIHPTLTPLTERKILLEMALQREMQRNLYTPESLGLQSTENANIFIGETKKTGEKIILRQAAESDYQAIYDLQIQGWGWQNEGSDNAVRPEDLAIFNQPDNVMLVAENEAGDLVSFVFGFPGLKDNKLVMYSHMASTRPDYQSQGVMQLIKKAQIILCAKQGMDQIRWTYDPSYESTAPNHHVNINSLAGVVDTFVFNPYPPSIQVGEAYGNNDPKPRPTHRFEIVLELNRQTFKDQITGKAPKMPLNIDQAEALPLATPNSQEPLLKYPACPNPKSKTAWLLQMETVIPILIDKGYRVTGYSTDFDPKTKNSTKSYFILEKNET